MQYLPFNERAEDVALRLARLSRTAGLGESEKARLMELSNMVGQELPAALSKGLTYKQARIVETLETALDTIEKDGVVKVSEVKKLIQITDDLEITEEEMKDLEKTGENSEG